MQKVSFDLDDMIDEMHDMYSIRGSSADPALSVSWGDLRVGLYLAARVEGEEKWYRVLVDKVNSMLSIQVSLLDFGGNFTLPLFSLRWLLAQFCNLPAQAMPAKLAGVAPPHGCNRWPQSSSVRLLDLTRKACEKEGNRGLVARIQELEQGGKLMLRLFDTVTNTEPEGIDLGIVLLDEGLARIPSNLSNDYKYLAERLDTGKTYSYSPLRCPDFLNPSGDEVVLESGKELKLNSYSSDLSEDTSVKSQLKTLLNLQNSIHSIVSKNFVTDQVEDVFTRMTELQSQYQALLVMLLRKMPSKEERLGLTEVQQNLKCVSSALNCEGNEVVSLIPPESGGNLLEEYFLSAQEERSFFETSAHDAQTIVVTYVPLSSGHAIHPVFMEDMFWVTSAEVSTHISHWFGYDLLARMLERKKASNRVSTTISFLVLMILDL